MRVPADRGLVIVCAIRVDMTHFGLYGFMPCSPFSNKNYVVRAVSLDYP